VNWWTVVGALVGGGIVQLIAALVGYYAKKNELTVTDDAGLRQSLQQQVTTLMEERKTLVGEVQAVAKRCSDIESESRTLSATNRELNAQMLKDQNEYYKTEHTLRVKVETLEGKVTELTTAKEELTHLRKVVDDLTAARNEIDALTRMVDDLTTAKTLVDDMLETQTKHLQTKLNEANMEIERLRGLLADAENKS
jgi:chromosome segregation ATPase